MKLIIVALLFICLLTLINSQRKTPILIDFVKEGYGVGLLSPKIIKIIGTPLNSMNRFSINFGVPGQMFKDANVPFHFNPRYAENQVILNNWINPTLFQKEERRGPPSPFVVGQKFILEFIGDSTNKININVNDQPFTTFERSDFDKITQFEITEAVEINSINLCKSVNIQNVAKNILIDLVKDEFGSGFVSPKKIIIVGTPISGGGNRFNIDFGPPGKMLNDADIIFHFNPRYPNKEVILNSWTKPNGWSKDEIKIPSPFIVGQKFVLEIIGDSKNKINVNINDKPFTTFERVDFDKITQFEISDAIKVDSVSLCRSV
jgi:hypothetical protein